MNESGTTIRGALRTAGRRALDRSSVFATAHRVYWQCRLAARGGDVAVRVGDATARFDVSTRSEYHRATRLGGEQHVVAALLDDLDGDDVVWDVGACVGTYASLVANRLESGRVVAFEPEPTNRERLRVNLRSNAPGKRWTVSPFALSDRNGSQSLTSEYREAGAGHHYLTTDGEGKLVEIRRGDALVETGLPAPTVAKIDVQGAELAVLQGMFDTLPDLRVLYLEVHPEKCRRYDTTASAVEEWLEGRGFALEHLGEPSTRRASVYYVRASR